MRSWFLVVVAVCVFACSCSAADGWQKLAGASIGRLSHYRRLQLNFEWNGRWDKNPPRVLSKQDERVLRDACVEKTWTSNKVIVVAGTKHDSSWLKELAKEPWGLEHLVYQSGDPEKPYYYEPFANEAGAYLMFMHQFYDCLPQFVAFIHGHRQKTWHSLDMVETLQNLRWSKIPGYTDINRKAAHKYATLDHKGTLPFGPIATGKDAYNGSFATYQIIEGKAYPYWSHIYLDEVAFARAYDHFFGPQGFGPMPEKVLHFCCGQFAATREAIRGRSRQFYQDALLYLRPENNDLTGHHQASRIYVMGDVFTVFYGMIMGKPAIYEKEISDCMLFDDCKDKET